MTREPEVHMEEICEEPELSCGLNKCRMIEIFTSKEGCRFKSADQSGMSILSACSSEGTLWLYNHP